MRAIENYKERIRLLLIGFGSTMILIAASCSNDDSVEMEPWQLEVAELKQAMSDYGDFEAAKAAGYDLDATGYRTQMGHHFLNATLLDDRFELMKPEVLLYAPDDSGTMQFVAVEYGMPIPDMDNPPPAPEAFTGSQDQWEINTEFNMWTLHVWIELENPNGIFSARNPVLP